MAVRRRKRRGNYRLKPKAAMILFAVAALAVAAIIVFSGGTPKDDKITKLLETEKFADGISIEGIDISGLTAGEAREKIAPEVSRLVSSMALTVRSESGEVTINPEDLSVKYNLEAVLRKAIIVGRSGNMFEAGGERSRVRQEGLEYKLESSYDEAALKTRMTAIVDEWSYPAVDATVELTGQFSQKFKYTDSKEGRVVDYDALLTLASARLKNRTFGAVEAPMIVQEPTVTTDLLKANTKKIASATTSFKTGSLGTANRMGNIKKAAEMIDGQVVQPGEEWSINDVLGPRTSELGWLDAPGIREGVLVDEPGGGICQVSTTLYNTLVKSDFEMTARRPHSWPSSYVDPGKDATISTGGPHLKFINNKDMPIYIFTLFDNTNKQITIDVYGPPLEDGVTIEFKTETKQKLEPDSKPKITVNNKLRAGEFMVVKDRKTGQIVKRWIEYVKDGKVIETKEMMDDRYNAIAGEYVIGPGTELDSNGVPKGKEFAGKTPGETPWPTESPSPSPNQEGSPSPDQGGTPTPTPTPPA
ncbi:MAG: VanW family protein [Christensenellales bacterium]|jgi:vancomycin resistance protein YoaR